MQTNTHYKHLLNELDDAIYFVDVDRQITFWNKAAERLTGFSAEEVIGSRCSDNILIHVDDQGNNLCKGMCPLADSIQTGDGHEAIVYLHHKDGHRIPVRIRTTASYNSAGEITGGIEVFRDERDPVAALGRWKSKRDLSFYDDLTGLPNERLLNRFIEERMVDLNRYGWSFGVVWMDLDGFSWMNETLGRDTGDAVLQLVGRTLMAVTRLNDLSGRIGDDEFLAVLSDAGQSDLLMAANRFRLLIQFSILPGDNPLSATISAGATIAIPGESPQDLLARAKRLSAESKAKGGNQVTEPG
ncbi:MAG: diguanylate cyclase domain-containing protein [Solirubrobacterales bacterium]